MPLDKQIIEAAGKQLFDQRDRYSKLARYVEGECLKIVRDNGIPAAVQSRVKKRDSLVGKLERHLADGNQQKIEAIDAVDDVFKIIGDVVGCRVTTYVEGDRERVVRLIEERFTNVEVERHAKPSGYRATHCQVCLPESLMDIEDTDNIRDLSAEVQVCSMLAHVWNEVEHDMRYKLDGIDDVDQYETSRLQALLDVTKDGDSYIEEMLQGRALRVAVLLVPSVSALFPNSPDFGLRAEYVLREAVRLGYNTFEKLKAKFLGENPEGRGRLIIEGVNEDLIANREEARLLNPDTSDIFLALLLEQHHADLCGLHFKELEGREPSRIAFLAAFYEEHATEIA